MKTRHPIELVKCWVITNDVSDYINLLVRIAPIICNQPLYSINATLIKSA